MKLQNRVYVQIERENNGNDYLVANKDLASCNNGRVGVYELVEELDKREATEIRRKGSKQWFKASKP